MKKDIYIEEMLASNNGNPMECYKKYMRDVLSRYFGVEEVVVSIDVVINDGVVNDVIVFIGSDKINRLINHTTRNNYDCVNLKMSRTTNSIRGYNEDGNYVYVPTSEYDNFALVCLYNDMFMAAKEFFKRAV